MSVQLQADPVGVEPEFVQYEVVDRVATIWFNRPEVKNCVNWGLLTQFGAALEHAVSLVADIVPPVTEDRSLAGDASRVLELVRSGQLVGAVRSVGIWS